MRAPLLATVISLSFSVVQAGEFFTLQGHGGPIMGIAVHQTSGQIATASFDNAVGIWQNDVPDWLEGHRAAVNRVAFIDETTLVSGGDDFQVFEWQRDHPTPRLLTTHQGKVLGLAISPDKQLVASASWDGTIALTQRSSGDTQVLRGHTAGVNAVTFDATGTRLNSASVDGSIRLWDVDSGQEIETFLRHGFGVNTLVINSAAGWLAYGAVDGATRVVNLADRTVIGDFTLDRRPILSMAHNAETGVLAVGDGEGYIMVVDTLNWRITRDFRATERGPIWALAMSPDGSNIHAAGLEDRMYSWPIETLTLHGQMQDTRPTYLKDPAAMPNGERQFARKCSICHTLDAGSARKAGPSLHRLFGRRAGTVEDYTYSPALDGSTIIWTSETINALFDIGPEHYIPGTKMPMQRITGAQDRIDLIEYLKTATNDEED